MKRLVIFEGHFSPPTNTHVRAVEELCTLFDKVVVVPTNSNRSTNASALVPPMHRAAMVDLAFQRQDGKVEIDFECLEREDSVSSENRDGCTALCTAVDTYLSIKKKYGAEYEVWCCFNMQLLAGLVRANASGDAEVDSASSPGALCMPDSVFLYGDCDAYVPCVSKDCKERLIGVLAEAGFVVFNRPERSFVKVPDKLPPKTMVLPQLDEYCLPATVREWVFNNNKEYIKHVPPAVADYIVSFMLYRGVPPPSTLFSAMDHIRALFIVDTRNPHAVELAKKMEHLEDKENPNIIIVLGGDGTVLRAIRENWRLRLPFFGINCGHVGFLANDQATAVERLLNPAVVLHDELTMHHLPLLSVRCVTEDDRVIDELAFNDAWVERAEGQSAWLEVCVDGIVRIKKLVSDGALVCTAAGSTSYAQSMGCCPVPVGTQVMCLVGSNVGMPVGWRPVFLPLGCTVEFRSVGGEKRPVRGVCDGVRIANIKSMRIKRSNFADCRLCFLKDNTMLNKLSRLQFPPAYDEYPAPHAGRPPSAPPNY